MVLIHFTVNIAKIKFRLNISDKQYRQYGSVMQVEMFGVTDSDTETSGNDLLMELVDIQKSLFTELGLHFRY